MWTQRKKGGIVSLPAHSSRLVMRAGKQFDGYCTVTVKGSDMPNA